MHYAIQHQTLSFDYLETTARKKVLKHSLIRVESGLVLVRLGKKEYAVESGEYIWIPFDCLCALSFFPQTAIQRIDLSCRLKENFPQNAGYVGETELINAIFNRLQQKALAEELKQHLLQAAKCELINFNPKLEMNSLSEQVSNWRPNASSSLSKSSQLVLQIREANKRRLSGTNQQSIIDDLFNGNEEDYRTLNQLILGANK
ncbi:AraC family transcriptional regulator [Vibrio marisflavi]|uniref:AraC family transcriptional regulator n=1 Tax=Vibrio marisflavi CECT 7928 TaxID=634439 RepID=A0ABM9A1K7_9VIBR|nr:AraC family transcriptional regulator [Vibrio marisflavi]CAH0537513.1 hypothetical protein VMF7928_01147 [Vibrio marisflavi CECT 7928]